MGEQDSEMTFVRLPALVASHLAHENFYRATALETGAAIGVAVAPCFTVASACASE